MEIKILAEEFDLKIIGQENKEIEIVTSLDDQTENGLTWVKSEKFITKANKGVVLVHKEVSLPDNSSVTFLVTEKSPKVVFSQILSKHFTPPIDYYLLNEVDKHLKNPNIKIGDNVFIGQNVIIGDGTVIYPNVVIEANSVIGENCLIKSHVSIGTEGLGLEMNPETDLLEKFPQLGKVIFEDYVEIGPNATVRRGALKDTIVRRGTKIGSLVNIGHNCDIGENCILTCNIVTSGSSKIGNNVFIGVNVVIRNGVNVGSDTQLGMGAVVTKSIPDNVVAYGNPAKVIRVNSEN